MTNASAPEVRAAVSAKLQWEATVDLLPEIICLLDRRRRVVRINRTIEQWKLASVRTAPGTELHALLHPRCRRRSCALRALISRVWNRAARGAAAEETADTVLGRTLSVAMRQMNGKRPMRDRNGRGYAACVIADVTALSVAQRELRQVNEMLEARVQARTQDLERANGELVQQIVRREQVEHELLKSRDELSHLSVELMRAQEAERHRIARELHDAVGQSLSAVKYTLERSQRLLEEPELGSLAETLDLAVTGVQRTLEDVRTISSSLRPPLLDDLGPASAIRDFCREWSRVYPDIALEVQLEVEDRQVPETLALSMFRIVQEGLNNVAKHARARNARVCALRANGHLKVEIWDDGVGLSLGPEYSGGSGLRGIRERAEHDNGRLNIESTPGRGTCLSVAWELASPRRA
jgi:signal transduction histidine kinase